jgi:hypothetical protein
LDSSARTVTIRPYAVARLDQANLDYAAVEERTRSGDSVEAVLVSAGPIDALRKAYPNYFLDTQVFVQAIKKVIGERVHRRANKPFQRTPARGRR